MTPEQKLYAAAIMVRVQDCIYPFRVPTDNRDTIERQYQRLLKSFRWCPMKAHGLDYQSAKV